MAPWPARALPALLAATLALAACAGGGTTAETPSGTSPTTVRLLAHDSFALSEDLVTRLEQEKGIRLEVITGGDAVEVVNRAILSAGNPDADVLFGVDNTLLPRAQTAGVFDPYTAPADGSLRPDLVASADGAVTPIDDGDVCVNIDDRWFSAKGMDPPRTLEDLADPRYRDLLVVQNPATSSPGLSFLLATVGHFGDGWRDYWARLRANGVTVVNGWSEAYLGEFSGGGGEGTRPLVVSYSTSPPAEIVYAADPKPARPSTSAMLDGCFHQVEYAGVLAGTPVPDAARAVVDWLASPEVQADIPLTMFVFPARSDVALPEVFEDFAPRPSSPQEPTGTTEEQAAWVDEWTEIVLR